ncbi:ankyrin repeat-containing domain protein [Mycena olivaceomarginata]|nr:ankyrin repeat-containing domain protein [Mycena olivaceomarginata]
MADLVGLIASVLQLVDVVAKSRNYIQDFRNAPHEQKELVLEIQNLGPLIRKLDERISVDEAHGSDTIIRNFKDPLRQLETMLERLAKKLDSDGIKKFSGRVTWPLWGKEDVNETLGAIERFKSSLTASLGMEIFNSTQDISSSLFEIAGEQRADHGYIILSLHQSAGDQRAHHVDTMSALQNAAEDQRLGTAYLSKSVRDIVANQEQHYNSAERRRIIEWASPLNFFPRQADILSNRQPGTGEWLLQDGTFKRWEAGEIRALWCRGIPGAGKTVLASIVVNDLQENLANETTGVAVVYPRSQGNRGALPTNLLAAIWQQLALGKPVSSVVHALYNKHCEQSTRPSLQEIYSVLHAAVLDCSSVYIVVDALDEYPEEHRDTLLRYLWKLGSAAKLMLTSRPHIGIDHIIPNVETLDVRASEEDIRRYLEGQILKSSRLSRHVDKPSSGLREVIEDKIVKRSDGMFLLAKLHIDSLMTKQNTAAVKDALLRLPSDLDGTYNDIVDRINRQSDDDRDLAWRTLSWVLNAKKPLRPSQLREVLAVYPSATQLDPDRLTDLDIILSVCAGLVAVDEVSNQVRVIHYTTQIYFQSPKVHTSLFPHAQSEITLTCMTYMRLTFEAFSHRLKQPLLLFTYNEFLHYAVEYCLVHAHGEPETYIQPSILYFLGNCSIWWRLWNWKHGGRQSVPDKLHIARAFNLEVICARIIKQNEALQEAIVQGATDNVRILVEEGISAEDEDRALETAVVHGCDEIFELLLAYCPSDRKSRGRFGAALYQASCRGNAHSVESLITHGADVNAEGGAYVTALHIDYGANVNVQCARYGTGSSALCAASSLGHKAIVQLLLDHGADVNAEGGEYGSAVEVAVEQGQEEIIQLLLQHGADANAELLYVAMCQGHEGIVRLLIEHGATSVGPHGNALCAASRLGHKAIVQLLLDHGADVNAEGGPFGNALQAALWNGKEDTAQLLIQRGANVNTPGLRNDTPLWVASKLGYETIVQQLLDLGADVNARDGVCGSAVQGAFENGHQSIVELLVEHGAEFNPISENRRYFRRRI